MEPECVDSGFAMASNSVNLPFAWNHIEIQYSLDISRTVWWLAAVPKVTTLAPSSGKYGAKRRV